MKKFLSLIVGITMSVCLFTGCGNKQQQIVNQNENIPYSAGTVTDGVYKNESLKLKYTPIENMRVANNEELATLKNQAQMTYSNQQASFLDTNVEYYAALSDVLAGVEILSYKLGNKDMSENDFVKEATSQQASEQFTGQPYKLGDTEFSKVSNVKMNDVSYTLFCKKVDDQYVMILTTADKEETLNKLLAGFSKL